VFVCVCVCMCVCVCVCECVCVRALECVCVSAFVLVCISVSVCAFYVCERVFKSGKQRGNNKRECAWECEYACTYEKHNELPQHRNETQKVSYSGCFPNQNKEQTD